MKNIHSFLIGSQNTKIECFHRKKKADLKYNQQNSDIFVLFLYVLETLTKSCMFAPSDQLIHAPTYISISCFRKG